MPSKKIFTLKARCKQTGSHRFNFFGRNFINFTDIVDDCAIGFRHIGRTRKQLCQGNLFEESAFNHGWTETGSELIAKIRAQILTDDTTFDVINAVYTQVTGREISWDEGISARSIG